MSSYQGTKQVVQVLKRPTEAACKNQAEPGKSLSSIYRLDIPPQKQNAECLLKFREPVRVTNCQPSFIAHRHTKQAFQSSTNKEICSPVT
jgi:hypothetical protein